MRIPRVLCLLLIATTGGAGCASQPATAPHRTHLGAILDQPTVELAPAEGGRTDDDRGRAERLLADGVRLRETGDLAGSQKALEEALQLNASLARAHVEWALTSEGLGVDAHLINAHYQLGARLAPDDARSQTLAAAWAARQGDVDRALEGYERALQAQPENVEALCRKADLLLLREPAQAVEAYQRALAVDKTWVPALIGLADAAEKAGNHEVAERAYKQLVKLYPDATLYRGRLVTFYKRTNQLAKATQAQKELERLEPRDTRKLRKLRR